MSVDRIGALLMFLAAISCILCANLAMFAMIGEVNRKLSENEQISYIGFYPTKYLTIHREYRRLYPQGRLLLLYRIHRPR